MYIFIQTPQLSSKKKSKFSSIQIQILNQTPNTHLTLIHTNTHTYTSVCGCLRPRRARGGGAGTFRCIDRGAPSAPAPRSREGAPAALGAPEDPALGDAASFVLSPFRVEGLSAPGVEQLIGIYGR